MADIPLKSDDETTNDLVNAVENIAQNVKLGSVDLTKSFNGLTKAIKVLQTTLVNAIKAIKIQVVAKQDKVSKQPIKSKETVVKESVKEKVSKVEEKVAKAPKIPKIEEKVSKEPKEPKLKKPVKTEEEKQALAQEKKYKNEVEKRQQNLKPVKVSSLIEGINQVGDAWSKVISNVKDSIEKEVKAKQEEEFRVIESGNEKSKKFVGPLKKDFEENERKKIIPGGPEFVGPPKELFNQAEIKNKEEERIAKLGKEGTKDFVGPPIKLLINAEKAAAEKFAKDAENASKLREKAEEEEAKAQKVLRSYFRKKQEESANEAAKAANDLVKEQERAAKELNAENQKVKKELDSLIAGFQSMTPLFRGPLVRYGLEMMAKGIGFKQPANELKTENQNVSYVGNVETESQMKPKGTDTQPAMLTPGEFVVNKKAYEKNKDEVEAINSGKPKKKTEYHAAGAVVGAVARSGASSAGTSASSSGAASGAASGATSSGAGSGGGGGKNLKSILGSFDFSNFSKSMKSFFSKFPVLGASTTALGIVFNSVTSSVKIANQALALFGQQVAKANPALMQKLDIVMNDLNGVIGRALIPSVEYLSPLFRKYADYVDYSMKRLTPAINKSAVAFDNLVSPLLDIGATIYSVLGPIFNGLATILVGLSSVIKPIIQFFSSLLSTIVTVVDILSSPVLYVAMATLTFAFNAMSFVIKTTLGIIQTLLGAFVNIVGLVIKGLGNIISYIPFMGGVGKKIAEGGEAISKSGELLKKGETGRIQKGSSVGAAVREVSSTSIAGVGDEIRKNAMMAASGQRTQEDMLGDIANKLDKNSLADAFADGIKKAGGEKPLATPPTPIQGQNPFASKPKDKVELGIV